jgi:DUF3047 family protein
MQGLIGLAMSLLILPSLTKAATRSTVEDWSTHPIGSVGVPAGWTAESFGRRAFYDFTVEAEGDLRALHLRSRDEHSTISKDIGGKVAIRNTPILEWTWKVTVLPIGGDLRRAETSDLAIQLYVVWPRFPAMLRSRVVGYVWDASAPVGLIALSQKTPRVTFVVLRSGSGHLGHWVTERRNVVEDYQRIFGEPPDDPQVVTLSIDSNDTHSSAEAFVGPIRFVAP